jgi:DeoR/GlpR family transcriptional regulator of sugar metabolism
MWQLLQEHGDVDPVVEQLLAEFDVEEAELRRDLALLIGQLEEAGLIRRR